LRVYPMHILCDVFNGKVFKDRNRGGVGALGRCHNVVG
jgi:hypothetical protein